ncbi:ABC transporter substrate-binding protein [Demequina mangrovi]|uniref:Carbohydrate ABC transporter substrate-binding protein, CUT1 family n=1 Tax=Demequina mangrovi TaxID=1043493 RepID=A0A1H7ACN1_9MICO|nr:ABC transporter substrate-binding protein [Demequina mangrovi]SEJ62304.1 carbohydrate ABC transporter substrate-binding protein, CUT1 family [Demequina mangrovi]
MTRRIIYPAVGLALGGLVLAGCSSSDEPGDSGSSGDGGDGGAMAAGCEAYADYGTFDGESVEIYGTQVDEEADRLVESWMEFEECTGITVEWIGNQEFETQMNVRVEAGDPPDLAIFPQPGLAARFIEGGSVVPAPESVEANVDEFWTESWKEYGTVDGTFYAAPLMASVKGWIWYSPTQFAENGYEVPETWDDMMALTAQMAEDGADNSQYRPWCIGFESGEATGWPGTDWIEDIVLRQQGAETYDAWVAGDVKFSDPEIVEAFDTFGEIALNADYVNGGIGGPETIASTAFGDGGLPILDGNCSLHHQASFYEGFWPEGTVVAEDGDIWAFITPKINADDPDAVTGGGEFITAFNDNPATVAFQTFLSSDTWANIRVGLGGVISANQGLDPANASSELGTAAIELLQSEDTLFKFDGADLMPAAVGSASFWTGITDWVQGTKSTEEVTSFIDGTWPSS